MQNVDFCNIHITKFPAAIYTVNGKYHAVGNYCSNSTCQRRILVNITSVAQTFG